MKPTYPYTVEYGDWLAKIAEEHGTTVAEIWSHPDNAEHRAKRGSPDVLYPGDVIHIPYEPEIPPPPSTPPPPPSLPSLPPEIPLPQVPPEIVPQIPPQIPLPNLGALALIIDAAPFQHFEVLQFRGEESISAPFRFEITAMVPDASIAHLGGELLGRRAAFLFTTTVPRVVRGVVASARIVDVPTTSGVQAVRFVLVPHLELLRHVRRSRIFQDLTVVEIAEQVLFAAGIGVRTSLTEELPKRRYCTQYEESDLAFVRRILAEAGLYFALDGLLEELSIESLVGMVIGGVSLPEDIPAINPETWVIGDSPIGYPAVLDASSALIPGAAAALPFIPSDLVDGTPAIWELDRECQLRATAASYRDYDPDHPGFELFARRQLSEPEGDLRRPNTPQGGTLELEHEEHKFRAAYSLAYASRISRSAEPSPSSTAYRTSQQRRKPGTRATLRGSPSRSSRA
ncbi:MAG: contractile injection system protein, VgrG/Pvc8 family [Polyangiaceae bacterium]